MARISLDRLAHTYLAEPSSEADFALKELNHDWADGEAYALLGPSGCGKSTLLNIISGLLIPSHGRVLFDGNDVTHLPTAERNIAQVFQFPVVYDTMTVRENLAFPLKNRKLPAEEIRARVDRVARMIGMDSTIDRRAAGLTADAKQKISLGRGMVRDDVNALLFDEPLTVIDPHMKWELRTQLKQLHRDFGHTMIYVTHDQTEALTFADRVVVMNDGVVVQIGTPEELFERPQHIFVGYFIGSPGMNLFDAEIEGTKARIAGTQFDLGTTYRTAGGALKIGVRPEYIRLAETGLPARVTRVEDVGRHKVIHLDVGGQEASAIADESRSVPDGGTHVQFVDRGVNVYENDWRVAPSHESEAA